MKLHPASFKQCSTWKPLFPWQFGPPAATMALETYWAHIPVGFLFCWAASTIVLPNSAGLNTVGFSDFLAMAHFQMGQPACRRHGGWQLWGKDYPNNLFTTSKNTAMLHSDKF